MQHFSAGEARLVCKAAELTGAGAGGAACCSGGGVPSTGFPFLGEACFFEALVSFGVLLEFFGIFSPIIGTSDPVDDAHQSVSD
jgi:hypothetical protein